MQITVFGCEEDERNSFCQYAKSYNINLNILEEPASVRTARFAGGSKCISVSHKTQLCGATLSELKNNGVELVTTRSIGTNHIDLSVAERLGMRVEGITYSPDGVADHTIMLILMALRNAKDVLWRMEDRDFSLAQKRSPDLCDMTVGVIGYGRIGREVANRLKAFGCNILIYDAEQDAGSSSLTFDEFIGQCDILTFHLPLTDETFHILNRKNIFKLKDGAYIINTGRGGLIETGALLEALNTNKIRGAALDVMEGEEDLFYRDHRDRDISNEAYLQLCNKSNVIITPHTAYYTQQALIDTVENTILKCLDYGRSNKWTS